MTGKLCTECLMMIPDSDSALPFPPIELFDGRIFESDRCETCAGGSIAAIPAIEVLENPLDWIATAIAEQGGL